MVTCILLSAGLSRRFGSPKALAQLKGQTVIELLQNTLLKTQVDEIIIVLGASADRVKPYLLNHTKVKFVYNKDYNLGQTSSFKAGLHNVARGTKGFLLLPVDYPFVREQTIDGLIQFFKKENGLIVVPAFNGQKGHPPIFSMSLRDEFLNLDDSSGINTVGHNYSGDMKVLPVGDEGVVKTFNTQAEFERLTQDINE